ncbi:MAG: peptidylprolyl isomerase [Bdellovibrionales bacterium]|nr:peptidylprolyl isomerase [Bdellovibrionales bacterium]
MKQIKLVLLVVLSLGFGFNAFSGSIATVNGKVITDADLQSLVSTLPFQQRELVKKDQNLRKKMISDLIDQELMLQEAAAEKIESTKEYQDALNIMRKQALVNAIVSKKLASKVTPQAVKEYYNSRKSSYSTDQIHAQHILLSTEKEAEEVLNQVMQPGVDFQRVAEARSKDPTAKNTRGDVGFFSRNMFDQAFTDAAFKTRVGEITGPVKTAFGFHIIKVVDRKVGKIQELAEVEQEVRTDFQRDLLRNFVMGLRRKAKIKE